MDILVIYAYMYARGQNNRTGGGQAWEISSRYNEKIFVPKLFFAGLDEFH